MYAYQLFQSVPTADIIYYVHVLLKYYANAVGD